MADLKSPEVSVNADRFYTIQPASSEGTGILHPQHQNRFKLEIAPTQPTSWKQFSEADRFSFAMQVKSVAVNLRDKELRVEIEQPGKLPHSQSMMELIEYLINASADYDISPSRHEILASLKLTTLDGNDNATFILDFQLCQCVNHEFWFDYSTSDAVVHVLDFKFNSFNTIK